MLSFKKFHKSKSDFSSEEEYNKQNDLFNNNKQLLPVYLVEEIEECEKRIGFTLPIALIILQKFPVILFIIFMGFIKKLI